MNSKDPDDDRTVKLKIAEARLKIAIGIMWCLIWLGFGGCCFLANRSGAIVDIKTEPPKHEAR